MATTTWTKYYGNYPVRITREQTPENCANPPTDEDFDAKAILDGCLSYHCPYCGQHINDRCLPNCDELARQKIPAAPYPFCSAPAVCIPKGYCQKDPCCAD